MKKKDVEKAALLYVSQSNLDDYAEAIDVRNAFVDGAHWRINSVWHDIDEVQDGKRAYIVQYNEEWKFAIFVKPIPIPLEQAKSVFKRWAYMEDLITTNE